MQKLNVLRNSFDDNDLANSLDFGTMLNHMNAIINGVMPDNEKESILHFCTQIGLDADSPVMLLYRAYMVGFYAGLDEAEEGPCNKILNYMERSRAMEQSRD